MLETSFKTIGIVVRQQSSGHKDEIRKIFDALMTYGELLIHYLDEDITLQDYPSANIEQIGEEADLVVSVGGDGTLLTTTRLLVDYQIPLVGINLGRLGFLADVTMLELKQHLDEIFSGNYSIEKRFLLQGEIELHEGLTSSHIGLNDIILHSHESVSMIEFEVFSDGKLINRQRADGLIVSTPTGSTAYSLSGGGPIMHPSLQAISLVPICPHTLSYRPIVLPADRQIDIQLSHDMAAQVSFDGVTRSIINSQDKIHIQRYHKEITLLHPAGYNYFHILRAKLNWSNHP
jgi:NAD+ kinase